MNIEQHTEAVMNKLGLAYVRTEYAIQTMNMVSEWIYYAGPRGTWTKSIQGAWKFDEIELAEAVLPTARKASCMANAARIVEVTTVRTPYGKHEYHWNVVNEWRGFR
jgi:hypothetical protein